MRKSDKRTVPFCRSANIVVMLLTIFKTYSRHHFLFISSLYCVKHKQFTRFYTILLSKFAQPLCGEISRNLPLK